MLKEAKQKHVTILNVHISTQSRYPVSNQGEILGEIIAGCFPGSAEGAPLLQGPGGLQILKLNYEYINT